jgi:hypothetical protein
MPSVRCKIGAMTSPTPHTPVIKPKRQKTDWDALQRDYRTGKFTLRELAEKYPVSHQRIAAVAKEREWTQDLSLAIKQATNAKLVNDLVANEVARGGQAVANTVLAAAELNKQVILGHRKDAQEARSAMAEARVAVLKCGASVVDMREAAAFASAVESLSRTVKNAIEIERKAFGLDEAPTEKPAAGPAASNSFASLRAKFDEVLGRTLIG